MTRQAKTPKGHHKQDMRNLDIYSAIYAEKKYGLTRFDSLQKWPNEIKTDVFQNGPTKGKLIVIKNRKKKK